MSSVETLRPIFHQNLHSNSYQKLFNRHGLHFFCGPSRVFHRNLERFIPSSLSFPSTDMYGQAPGVSKNSERFNLWGGRVRDCGFRKNRIRASSQDSDSAAGSTGTSESESNKNSPNSSSSAPNRRTDKQGKGNGWWSKGKKWQWQWQPMVQAQEIGVLLLQLGIVIFVMRLLRPGIPLPGSEPRTQTTFITVPYSEFLTKINSNEVQKVEVDGVHIMFKLKSEPGSRDIEVGGASSKLLESEALLRSVAPTKRIVYTTTRPSDIKAPYEKMLENAVEFGSPDRRSGGFVNSALVSFFAVVTLCSICYCIIVC